MCKHLPPKQEYVLSLRLCDVQEKLYKYYLQNKSVALSSGEKVSGRGLFADFQTFLLVNNHPKCLHVQTENKEQRITMYEAVNKLHKFLILTLNS